ncbi:pentatricopeptide repeat-containing protein At4g18975, chloroplastic-like isoform X1 [Tasmannia lanceolata]|uniref:pentatricopeptide repeat-containing protein At4g18975, chloroplastic-like isoform X1 n=1 Tax=Tasmannia lanceolata TaxID=3420 RepID=UPI00406318E0
MASRLSTRFLRLASNSPTVVNSLGNWSSKMKVNQVTQPCSSYSSRAIGDQTYHSDSKSVVQNRCDSSGMASPEVPHGYQDMDRYRKSNMVGSRNHRIGENVPRRAKIHFLVDTLFDLKESKEALYDALDAWVAWEQNFPISSLKKAMCTLEKEQQWHRVIQIISFQVIKWMLSKGQGTTMGTYEQLIRALDNDDRAEEAHTFWVNKIGHDLHSVPWKLCDLMISIYYRNNMLERLVKLFKGLEAFDRKPQNKNTVQKVANTYEMLGLLEEQKRVMEKYNELFSESSKGKSKKSK